MKHKKEQCLIFGEYDPSRQGLSAEGWIMVIITGIIWYFTKVNFWWGLFLFFIVGTTSLIYLERDTISMGEMLILILIATGLWIIFFKNAL